MSSSQVRQRAGQKEKKAPQSPSQSRDSDLNGIIHDTKLPAAVTSEWDYKLALGVITLLAFVTRFWGIGHPNEVVFDEVHFGKVCQYHGLRLEASKLRLKAKFEQCTDGSLYSLHHITYNERISSMFIPPSGSFSSPSWAGLSATMGTSSSIILETPTFPTRSHTLLFGPCQLFLDRSPCPRCS